MVSIVPRLILQNSCQSMYVLILWGLDFHLGLGYVYILHTTIL